MKPQTKGKAIVDFEKIIEVVYSDGYNEGEKMGLGAGKEMAEQEFEMEEEKRNSEYATVEFSDCKTLSDFQDKYNEIRNLSYTYMK